jgi:hypothetical protein
MHRRAASLQLLREKWTRVSGNAIVLNLALIKYDMSVRFRVEEFVTVNDKVVAQKSKRMGNLGFE